jgi:hypothetical protein
MDLGQIGWCGMGWTDLAQDRDHVNMVMNFQVT